MSANKVTLNGEVIIDISEDTVTEADVKSGKTFHKANGSAAVGSAALAKPEEAKTVNLDFSGGSMTVSPAAGGVLSSVLINKPSNLIPENVRKYVNIAGISGTYEPESSKKVWVFGIGGSSGVIEFTRYNDEESESAAEIDRIAAEISEGAVYKAAIEIEGSPQPVCDVLRGEGNETGVVNIQTSSTNYLYYPVSGYAGTDGTLYIFKVS